MKKLILFLFIAPFIAVGQQKLTVEDIWGKYIFRSASATGFNVLRDGLTYVERGENQAGDVLLLKYDLKTGKPIGEMARDDISYDGQHLDIFTYELSPGEDKLLLYREMEYIYRHSSKAFYYIYDLKTKQATELDAAGKQMFPKFSPDGTKVAFVRDNNIYIKNLVTGFQVAVTTDGVNNQVKNGWGDWVYEEEFSKPDYFEWSNDSRYLAYVRFDESKVKEYGMDLYKGELYPQRYTFKYPKAGEDNSVVSVEIYDGTTKKYVTADIGAETDIYIPRINFTNDPSTLCFQRLNRLQNKLEYIFTNVTTGKSRVVHTNESKTYVDITDDLTFIDNKGFIISSEADGYNHLYFYDLNGKLVNRLTSGNWDVVEFKGYNAAAGTVYFASSENGAINRDMYSVKLNGKDKKRLSSKPGQTDFDFTRGYKFYVSSYSNSDAPPLYELYSIDGKLVKVLEDNKALKERMKNYRLSNRRFITIPNAQGTAMNAWMMKPVDFDSTKKYPVYMYAYNGPGSNLCNNGWGGNDYFWHNLLNQEGYIVVCVDGRGTGGRGREFKHCTYLQLGKFETEDQLAAAKYLGNLSYVDKTRIGFQGWSYGGYMAALMLTKGADLIKTAVAVAPVTNWKYYDNIYTERFMRKPQDNKGGYEDNSPVNFVKNIRGKLLLVHGSADDNVHLQNSMELAAALVNNNIPFDFMVYPNKNHSISGGLTRLHIYSKILKFVKENL